MPLSDREQQILSDIESRLKAEDPKFAKHVGTTRTAEPGGARRRIRYAVAVFALGFFSLLATIPAQSIWFGIVGFAAMLGSVVFGAAQLKRLSQDPNDPTAAPLRGGLSRYLGERPTGEDGAER